MLVLGAGYSHVDQLCSGRFKYRSRLCHVYFRCQASLISVFIELQCLFVLCDGVSKQLLFGIEGSHGEVVDRMPTQGLLPTNVAFGLPGEHKIHVTEFQQGQVEVFPVNRDGLPLWDGKRHGRSAQ